MIRSEFGKGSTFGISVPEVHVKCESKSQVELLPYKKRWLEGINILCVDDDLEILKASRSLLERWGAHLICVDTPSKLHNIIGSGHIFNVVLMDYQLGADENGLSLLMACKGAYGENFLGVLVTAEQDVSLKKQAIDHGFQFLAKPVEPAKLRTLLQSGLSKNLK